ncbi:MAG: lysylphosphatidylglycerol synthase transmembrane domain-containing protein [Nannocystaceae bacterium]
MAAQLDSGDDPIGPLRALLVGRERTIIAMVMFTVAVYGGLLIWADVGALGRKIKEFDPSIWATAAGLSVGNYLLRFLRWSYYLRRLSIRVPVAESLLIFFGGFSMAVTPAKIGELIKSLLLSKSHGVELARSAPILVIERVTDLTGLIALAALGSLSLDHGVVFMMLGLAITFLVILLASWRPLGDGILGLLGRISKLERITERLVVAYAALRAVASPVPMIAATVLSMLAWGLHCLALMILANALHAASISVADSLVSYSAPLLAGTLALLPGGLGLTEASMAGLLVELGSPAVAPADAAAITIVTRMVTLWLAVALGLAALAIWQRLYDRGTDASCPSPKGDPDLIASATPPSRGVDDNA